jgi:two-component system, OmpR family, phosphate regulon sensor histidine kinase PhoR
MNRKAIISLIILMSTALLGLTLIQAYWINWSVKLNKEKLDKNIFDALNDVANRLRQREISTTMKAFTQNVDVRDVETWSEDEDIKIRALISALYEPNTQENPQPEQFSKANLESILTRLSRQPIAERIDLQALDKYINQELKNRGIETEYSYAVVSNVSNNMVVLDGYYVFDEELPSVVHTGINVGLMSSPYRVELFKDADRIESTGQLIIHFPKLNRDLWDTLWGTLIGSIIFTGLVLFCFVYTISIIFRQKKLSEMKTDFINNMTHEFKTPIATIGLAAESIGSDKIIKSPEAIKRFANIIRQENERMLSQVEQVLQIAQMDKEIMNLHLQELNIHDMLTRAANQISVQIDHRNGVLKTSFNADECNILGDQVHVENIIFNLLDNAIKYSREELIIEIATVNQNGFIEIEFKDEGIGISKEQNKYIFDKFYRVHTGNIHDVKGFGLGLSYVKTIVEAHSGTIEVQSELGKGSSFFIKFPTIKRNQESTIKMKNELPI